MAAEKRKYVRFLAGPNSYAALGSSFTKIGKIRNISMGGLAFEYFSVTDDTSKQDSTVTIFLTVNNFFLEGLPCQLICDHREVNSDEMKLLNSKYHVKRCSLQFTTISEDQRQYLEYFINHHTQGIAASLYGEQDMN